MSSDIVEGRRVWTSKHGAKLREPTAAGGYFRLDYRDTNGKRHQPSVGRDEKRALVKLAEKEAELASGLGERGRQTVSELMDAFIAQARRDGSYTAKHEEAQRRFITPERDEAGRPQTRLGDVVVWSLTRDAVKACLEMPTAKTMKRHLRASLGAMLTWAYEDERIAQPREFYIARRPRNATQGAGQRAGETHEFIDQFKVPSVDAVHQVADLVRESRPGRRGLQAWLMVALSAGCGIRQGELLALRPRDFDFLGGELHVRRQVQGRTEKLPKWGRVRSTLIPRRTIWGEPLEDVLAEYLEGVPADGLVFAAPQGGYWNPSNLRTRVMEPAMVAAPLWDAAWSWHSLRHTFCTFMLGDESQTGKKAAAVTDVTNAAGHRDSHTTLAMYVGRTKGGTGRLRDLT